MIKILLIFSFILSIVYGKGESGMLEFFKNKEKLIFRLRDGVKEALE